AMLAYRALQLRHQPLISGVHRCEMIRPCPHQARAKVVQRSQSMRWPRRHKNGSQSRFEAAGEARSGLQRLVRTRRWEGANIRLVPIADLLPFEQRVQNAEIGTRKIGDDIAWRRLMVRAV